MKIGVTVDKNKVSPTTLNIINCLRRADEVTEITLLAINVSASKGSRIGSRRYSFLLRIERLLQRLINYLGFLGLIRARVKRDPEVKDILRSFREVELSQIRKGPVSFTKADGLECMDLDLILRGCGLGIERGEILTKGSKKGLFGIHHGDNWIFRGGPSGFWEIIKGSESLGIIFQKYTKELDGGVVLVKARLPNGLSWACNNDLMEANLFPILKKGLRLINGDLIKTSIPPYDVCESSLFKSPAMLITLNYFFLTLLNVSREVISNLRRKVLGYIDYQRLLRDNWEIICIKNSGNLTKPHDRLKMTREFWYADPFHTPIGDGFLLCERYDRKNRKAVIVSFKIKEGKIDRSSELVILDNGKHASYPYTFQRDHRFYFMPEEGEYGVNIYELSIVDGNLRSHKIKNILPKGYVEPSVVDYRGQDLLFVNTGMIAGQNNILELYLSDNILAKPLVEHELNPILVDSKIGRGAGRLKVIDDVVYRPSQDGLKYYGRKLHFTKANLNDKNLRFSVYRTIEGKHRDSQIHHFESWEEGENCFSFLDLNGVSFRE